MKTFYVEHEVPPTRAIHHNYFEADSEKKLREAIGEQHPFWRIRKVTACCPNCNCIEDEDGCGCNPVGA